MELLYKSTRSADKTVTASYAILKGLAEDGGLFVPTSFPKLDVSIDRLADMSYQEVAYEVMKLFLTDFTEEELKHCINSAYDQKFDTEVIAPLVKADDAYYLELFHGKTIAFKDMALSILPYLMTTAARKNNVKNEIVILTATSGDTGKAALTGFADVPGTKIIVFYPKDGVSPVQEKQMVTQKGDNTFVVGIHGNFDDAQTGVKKMFGCETLNRELNAAGYQFSSANSIKVLYDFFATGTYDRNREFHVTTSPSMDILISSNLERLIYQIAGQDAAKDNQLMKSLSETGVYGITPAMRENLKDFYGNYATEEETAKVIHDLYAKTGYVIDTHTAVAASVYKKYVTETHDTTPTVIASTASPFKFARSVMTAIKGDVSQYSEFELVDQLTAVSNVAEPAAVTEIRTAPVRHTTVCDKTEMEATVKKFLGIQ